MYVIVIKKKYMIFFYYGKSYFYIMYRLMSTQKSSYYPTVFRLGQRGHHIFAIYNAFSTKR